MTVFIAGIAINPQLHCETDSYCDMRAGILGVMVHSPAIVCSVLAGVSYYLNVAAFFWSAGFGESKGDAEAQQECGKNPKGSFHWGIPLRKKDLIASRIQQSLESGGARTNGVEDFGADFGVRDNCPVTQS
jgi:hypothetical protein